MAAGTGHFDMRPGQRESRLRMVEGCRLPARSGVALRAVLPKQAVVGILPGMAGITILRGSSQVGDGLRLWVALVTAGGCVFSGQLKRNLLVIKILAIGIFAVMAGKAVLPKGGDMSLHENRIQAGVAGGANRGIKADIAVFMAVSALRGRTIGPCLVRQERIAGLVVRKGLQVDHRQRRRRTAVLGVAAIAAGYFALGKHDFVKIVGVLHQVGVTGQTLIHHTATAPGRDMTGGAVLNFSMGFYATQGSLAGLGI